MRGATFSPRGFDDLSEIHMRVHIHFTGRKMCECERLGSVVYAGCLRYGCVKTLQCRSLKIVTFKIVRGLCNNCDLIAVSQVDNFCVALCDFHVKSPLLCATLDESNRLHRRNYFFRAGRTKR